MEAVVGEVELVPATMVAGDKGVVVIKTMLKREALAGEQAPRKQVRMDGLAVDLGDPKSYLTNLCNAPLGM